MSRINPFHTLILLLTLFSAVTFIACSDEEAYTLSPSALLQFEQDTVRFDTVFTTIGSSTKRIRIYNRNKDGIHLQSVQLASGGTSGFRINVDGHSGTNITDLDVLGRDSIFMFAEVTVNPQDSNSPVLVRDSVLFHLESGVTQKLWLEAYGQDVIIIRAATLTTDTLLSDPRPYLIYDSLVVASQVTLTLAQGVTLCFHNGAYLGVHGQLMCQGTAEHKIVMRGDRTDHIFTYLPYDRMDGQWGGILLYPESHDNVLDHVDIHGGNWGVDCPLSTTEAQKVTMNHVSIGNVRGDALRLFAVNGTFYNCLFWNAGGNCVNLIGGTNDFVHCTLAQFYPWDTSHGASLYFTNCVGDTIYPLHRAAFANSILTARTADAIIGEPSDNSDAAFAASFHHCLVNIDLPDNSPSYIQSMFTTAINEFGYFPKSSQATAHTDTTKVYGAKNFRSINDNTYAYDFHLDSLSNARHIGSNSYVTTCPTDIDGKPRDVSHPDAGCYEF